MLEMGDELWRTQRGNNNPYCHDSELTWVDWRMDSEKREMLEHVRALSAMRMRHPVFRRRDFLRGTASSGGQEKDITWLRADGVEMQAADWAQPEVAAIAFRLDGDGVDDSFVVMMNGGAEPVSFVAPAASFGQVWRVVVDTRQYPHLGEVVRASGGVVMSPRSVVVMVDVSRESP